MFAEANVEVCTQADSLELTLDLSSDNSTVLNPGKTINSPETNSNSRVGQQARMTRH